ncbi:MAG: hypothetical protein AAGB05_13850 [Pseudomonadota bacterium]
MKASHVQRERLVRLERLAHIKSTVERSRLARAARDEARLAQEVAAIVDRRHATTARIAQDATPEMALIAATGAWLRASEGELRRMNIQLAALRARTETLRAETARAVARHAVCETLVARAQRAWARQRSKL